MRPEVYALIESSQSFRSKKKWLVNLCQTVNKKKHDSLVAQSKTVKERFTAKTAGGSVMSLPAHSIKGGVNITMDGIKVEFDPVRGVPFKAPGLQVDVKPWVCFYFTDTQIEVLPLLKSSLVEIKKLSVDIYKIIT